MRIGHQSFWDRARAAVAQGRRLLIYETWARGGGQTSWFLIDRPSDLEASVAAIQPGSHVFLYVDPVFDVETSAGGAVGSGVDRLLRELEIPSDALLALAPRSGSPECDAEFPVSKEEFEEWLAGREGSSILVRRYPRLGEDDGETITPDADGVVREH